MNQFSWISCVTDSNKFYNFTVLITALFLLSQSGGKGIYFSISKVLKEYCFISFCLNTASAISDLGDPVFFSHSIILPTLSLSPSAWPTTVPFLKWNNDQFSIVRWNTTSLSTIVQISAYYCQNNFYFKSQKCIHTLYFLPILLCLISQPLTWCVF